MSGTSIGLIGFGCLLGMLAIRVHITMAMFITGIGMPRSRTLAASASCTSLPAFRHSGFFW